MAYPPNSGVPLVNDTVPGDGTGTPIRAEHIWDIVEELGTNPSGDASTVTERLADMDDAIAAGGGGGGGGGGFTLVHVISNDAPAAIKALASAYVLVCDGANDEVEINQAINIAAPLYSKNNASGIDGTSRQLGKVQLSGGTFNISAGIYLRTGVWLAGQGWLTELRSVGCNAPGVINLLTEGEHVVHVTSLWINLNNSGTANGIDFDMSDSTNAQMGLYPPSNPDAYHLIRDIFITDGENAGANTDHTSGNEDRIGIRMWVSLESDGGQHRGWIIDACQIRRLSGHGISVEGASDGFITSCHIGTIGYDDESLVSVNSTGVFIEGANTRLTNVKAFYVQGPGIWIFSGTSGCTIVGCEAQDSLTGVLVQSKWNNFSGLTVDHCLVGIDIDHDGCVFNGVMVISAAQRFETDMTYGVRINTDCHYNMVTGYVAADGITTPVLNSGSATSNLVKVATGTAIVTIPATNW